MRRTPIRYKKGAGRFPGPDIAPQNVSTIMSAEGPLLLASDVQGGIVENNDGSQFVIMILKAGALGLQAQFTPDGARDYARALMASADRIDAALARQANDVLARIRRERKA